MPVAFDMEKQKKLSIDRMMNLYCYGCGGCHSFSAVCGVPTTYNFVTRKEYILALSEEEQAKYLYLDGYE